MKFLYPGWLWGLTVIPALFLLILWDERLRKNRFTRFAAEATWKILAPELDFGSRIRKGAAWLGAAAFILIALARPQWGTHEETTKISGLDVMVALDISRSMEVEDVIPNRLKKAKHEIRSLVERLQGDRVGLVTFAASAQVSCPLTTDLSYLLDTVQMIDPSFALSQGTDIGLALDTAFKSIERGAQENSGTEQEQELNKGSQAIILLTDGEDQEDDLADIEKKIKVTGTKLYIIGVGSSKGGPIPVRDENGNLVGYKKDHKGESVMSTFRPDTLQKLANESGGKFWAATDNENEVDDLIQDLGGLNRSEFAERKYVVFQERFQYPLAIAIFFLLLEMGLPIRKRRALPGPLLIVFGLLTFFPKPASAVPLEAYLENEKGIQSLKDGKVDEAKQEFGTAQAVSPDLPELQFNEGVVQLQEGDAESAAKSFDESARKSLGIDPKFAAKSFYNLGVAQTKKGDFKGAVKSYFSTIQQSQAAHDPELEANARKNLELLAQEQQKQKQQQKQDQEKKDQEKKQEQNQQQQQDQKKPQDQKDQKNQKDQQQQQQQKQKEQDQAKKDQDQKKDQGKPDQSDPGKDQAKQYQNPEQQQGFKSNKLSKEDADRVMEELKHREKELQSKLKKKYANSQTSYNDW